MIQIFFFLIGELPPTIAPSVTALLVAMHAVSTYPLLVLQQFLGLVLIQLLDAVKRVSTVVRQRRTQALAFMQLR